MRKKTSSFDDDGSYIMARWAILAAVSFCLLATTTTLGTAAAVSSEATGFLSIINSFLANSTSELGDGDVELTTPQMIERAGYQAEGHVTITEDGYILTIHRIRGKPGSRSVFLQHGLLGSSSDWVIAGKGRALAYLLSDKGYDVWLGNFRGNTYSRAHINLSSSDSKFWDFSWHELGMYDLPAMIRYVAKTTKEERILGYIGHSMGTTAFYVMGVERPEIGRMIERMISLAPVAFMSHLKSPVRLLAGFAEDYKAVAHFLGEDEFLPQNGLLKFLAKYGCSLTAAEEKICANSLFVLCGFDAAQFNYTLLPVILNHSPAGASTKTLVHYAQEIRSGYFRRYDYGEKRNREMYKNQTEPPSYQLSRISVPIAIIYSENDWFASTVDVKNLLAHLKTVTMVYKVPFRKFNHLDFLWAIDARSLVYEKVFSYLTETQDEEEKEEEEEEEEEAEKKKQVEPA